MSDENKSLSSSIISTNFFRYWTFSMVGLIIAAIVILVVLHENIIANFQTNIPLNGLIFAIIFIACVKAFENNLNLYRLSRFIRAIDDLEAEDDIDEEDTSNLLKKLANKGFLLDMFNMQRALEKMVTLGHFQVTDKEAMLIKSKLGVRVQNESSIVGYLAGTLVMLGLIGTFWGLLITIASVGDAMGEVSMSMSEQNSEESMAAMSKFIEGISRPLQGMGIAFSSSLFGLTGSLYVGLVNFFASHAQNRFMESMSRWLDYHIPSLSGDLRKEIKASGDGDDGDDELKSWLAAFVHLSTKMNRRMTMAFSSITQMNDHLSRHIQANAQNVAAQEDISRELKNLGRTLQDIEKTSKISAENSTALSAIQQNLQSNDNSFDPSPLVHNQTTMMNAVASLSDQLKDGFASLRTVADNLENLEKTLGKQNGQADVQSQTTQLSQLTLQINSLLQELEEQTDQVKGKIIGGE